MGRVGAAKPEHAMRGAMQDALAFDPLLIGARTSRVGRGSPPAHESSSTRHQLRLHGGTRQMQLSCPRCGYTISPRTAWLTVEHCPRCLARDRRAVQLQEPDRAAGEHGDGDASTASADEGDTPSARWISAFNMRDLAGMLACLDRDVRFHPLKLHGVASSGYRGHEGVERWFAEITARGHDHRIVVSEFRTLPAGVILTIGRLSFADVSAGTTVCGVHEVADGLIVTAHHYMSDPDTLERLGLLGRQQKPGSSGNLRISKTSQMIGR